MPLLQDGQDPDCLAARVAFHIHRLNLTTTALVDATSYHRTQALDLRNGRMQIAPGDAEVLRIALNIPDGELTRPLTDEENMNWRFYRISARHLAAVWRNVGRHVNRARYPLTDAAKVLRIDRANVARAIAGEPRLILQRPPGQRLAQALALGRAEIFLEGVEPVLPTTPRVTGNNPFDLER